MACIEVAPDRIEINRGKDINSSHVVMATNHYRLMPERNHRKDYNTSAYARLERLRMLLHLEKKYSVESIIKILSDHDGQEHGTNYTICRHRDLNMGTNNFLLFDDNFIMYYILGNPCRYADNPAILQTVHWKDLL